MNLTGNIDQPNNTTVFFFIQGMRRNYFGVFYKEL